MASYYLEGLPVIEGIYIVAHPTVTGKCAIMERRPDNLQFVSAVRVYPEGPGLASTQPEWGPCFVFESDPKRYGQMDLSIRESTILPLTYYEADDLIRALLDYRQKNLELPPS